MKVNDTVKFCPVCGKGIDSCFETKQTEPFTHSDPMLGLQMYGPFSMPKNVVCQVGRWLHFELGTEENHETRLVIFAEPVAKSSWEPLDKIDLPF